MQLAWLSEAYLLEGQVDEALKHAQQAMSLAQRHLERGHEAWSLRLLGAIACHGDVPDVETADGYFRGALVLADELGMRPLVAHCHAHLGRLFRNTGRLNQAREHLIAATTMYREMDMHAWTDRVEAEMRELS
jgi:tetratricopeptide (TPR) repeat protein